MLFFDFFVCVFFFCFQFSCFAHDALSPAPNSDIILKVGEEEREAEYGAAVIAS